MHAELRAAPPAAVYRLQYKDAKRGKVGVEGFGRLLDDAGRLVSMAGVAQRCACPAQSALSWPHVELWGFHSACACLYLSPTPRHHDFSPQPRPRPAGQPQVSHRACRVRKA